VSWRWAKRLGPFTVSRRGIRVKVGPFSIGGRSDVRASASLPGTGLSFRTRLAVPPRPDEEKS
jgi:hypothetical protein